MKGSSKTREMLTEALREAGLQVSNRNQGLSVVPPEGKREDIIYLQNGRRCPTFLEYSVAWYSESFASKQPNKIVTAQIVKRIVELREMGARKELREVRGLFNALDDNLKSVMPDRDYCERCLSKIESYFGTVREADVWFKLNHILCYFAHYHRFEFVPVERAHQGLTRGTGKYLDQQFS